MSSLSKISYSCKKRFVEGRWGAKSLAVLYLSLFSGVVVALQYDSANPYYSASTLDILVPFGSFWRSLHFYSSQLFLLFSILHFLVIVLERPSHPLPLSRWINLVLSLVVCLLLVFTGYILRGDATGCSAGLIAENILLSVPLVGKPLNWLLFHLAEEGVKRVYANHLAGLGLLWLTLSWQHVRRYAVSFWEHPWLLTLTLCFCAVVQAPMEPEQIGVFYISGPWFFIGLQELLRYAHPLLAGIFWPLTLVAALVLLYPESSWRRKAGIYACLWLVIYAVLTGVGLAR